MGTAKWAFAPTGGGFIDGINNPMISHFTGNFNYHLAREIIQNSLDARLTLQEPVLVQFSLEEFDQDNFPGFEEFKSILHECKKMWSEDQCATHDFLDNALNCLNQLKIPVLKCSDYNTTGLEGGDDEMKGSWFNLVRSRGASSKVRGEGGSYGIGKGAPFAASCLRTVFYFSKNSIGFPIFQGVAELVSFKENSEIRRGNGSYGIKGYSSIRRFEDIPRVFSRKSEELSGVDIFVMGFKKAENWIDELMKSVLRNFWYAIYNKELVVKVAGLTIDDKTIEKHLIKYFAGEKLKDDIEPTGNPLYYYRAVKPESKHTSTLKSLGDVEFYFSETPDHMNYVAMLRKPHMVVFSKAYRFPGNYCGVFICDNETGNQVLRKMEPPAHNKWEPESYGDKGFSILNEIHEWIRTILKSKFTVISKGKLEIPDLYKYLPFDEGDEVGSGVGYKEPNEQEAPKESTSEIQKAEADKMHGVKSPYRPTISNVREATGLGGGKKGIKNPEKKGRKKGDGVGGDSPEKKALSSKEISIISFINKRIPDGFEYLFKIKTDCDRQCSFKIYSVADDDSKSNISILKVFDEEGALLRNSGNRITRCKLTGGIEKKIYVQIKTKYKIALKTSANEL